MEVTGKEYITEWRVFLLLPTVHAGIPPSGYRDACMEGSLLVRNEDIALRFGLNS
jgi:hypothetical protein